MNQEALLRKAEEEDSFLSAVSKSSINRESRRDCSYTIFPDEKLRDAAMRYVKGFGSNGVNIVILSPSAEGGMPHTRGISSPLICLPAYFPESKLKNTIDHELIHISQKRNPEVWKSRLESDGWKEFSFERVEEIPLQWRNRCRINPDTCQSPFFAWKDRYIPLPLFVREDKPEIKDILVKWYDMDEQKLQGTAPNSFINKYGKLSDFAKEHPFELSAYI